ncbi:PREDICTED: pentatricopeptide repeat-containing protein At1g02370, mitochondrial [Tarenaya hassleriana]|uniref:pentatricopeptide repeat-containing protein At1g02370, mitochondrial n=1 Tax=Tarenaya hassleriana TaxID=28532 RepID=UPI00053CA6E8|nr:PREDICTED: pentatricopeptide repeat-containing protein At1g02370, mitochondrial [Tarenaya hassleriana]
MIARSVVSPGSRLARRFCTAVSAQAAGGEASASAPPPPAAKTAAESRAATSKHRSLYRTLSGLGADAGTVAGALNQFILEGNPVRKDELVRCIKELRRFRRYQHALEVYEWLEKRKVTFSVTDHAMRLDLIAKTKGLEVAESFFNSLDPAAKNVSTYGSMLNCYCTGLIEEKAKTHFQKMSDLNLVANSLPFNNMMGMYMRLGQPEKVSGLVDEMKQRNISPCSVSYSIWMQSCSSLNDIDGVENVLTEMANDSEDKSTWNTFANLAAIYTKAGLIEKAELALKSLEEKMNPRNRDSYHFLLSLYAGTSNHSEVYRVWDTLKTSLPEVNNTSYLVMLQALNKLNDTDGVRKLFEEWESRYRTYDMRLANLGISSYLKGDMYQEAEAVLSDAMQKCKGPFSKARQLLTIHLLKKGEAGSALKHLEAAVSGEKKDDWNWSSELIESFFLHYQKTEDVDGAEEFCRILKHFRPFDSDIYTLLLKTYVAAGKTSPDMQERLEGDAIEVNDELKELLHKVCP